MEAPANRGVSTDQSVTPAIRDVDAITATVSDAYERTAMRWGELQADASAANAVFKENHSVYKVLRGYEQGRVGISRLMGHESESVRLVAATHSLAWDPERATAVLETIERESGTLYAVDAKWTLRSFRKGTLDLDW
jgi:hypothetical protein